MLLAVHPARHLHEKVQSVSFPILPPRPFPTNMSPGIPMTNVTIFWNYPSNTPWIVFNVRRGSNFTTGAWSWPIVATTPNHFYKASITNTVAGFFVVTASNIDLHRESSFATTGP